MIVVLKRTNKPGCIEPKGVKMARDVISDVPTIELTFTDDTVITLRNVKIARVGVA